MSASLKLVDAPPAPQTPPATRGGGVQLSSEQDAALRGLLAGVRAKRPLQTLGGYAGTGKTVLISHLVGELPGWVVVAYTGKAADVLRKKGVYGARTIHSLIYEPIKDDTGATKWVRRAELPGVRGIIIDEASMVSETILRDLMAYEVPIIAVGDHGQLEPIGDGYNLMAQPEHRLETIHRNAGDIVRFAEMLRTGAGSSAPRRAGLTDGSVVFTKKRALQIDDALAADQIICAYNHTRVELNRKVRAAKLKARHLAGELPPDDGGPLVEGERIICLRNNRQLGLFNGMQGLASNFTEEWGRRLMTFDVDGAPFDRVPYDPEIFGQPKPTITWDPEAPMPFDYAYAVTCHKAQGSEWPAVLVFVQTSPSWDVKRWTYTAATRARTQLVWAE